jgi:hypothetical protein
MGRFLFLMLVWFAAGLLAALGMPAAGQGVGPTKSVKLVFVGFYNVDVQLWIDGKRVVARHMVTPDRSTEESLTMDGKVRRRSKLVLVFGNQRKEATVGSVAKLKTIYLAARMPITFSSDRAALD